MILVTRKKGSLVFTTRSNIMRKDMRGCVNVLHWNMWPKRFQSAHFSTTQLGPSAQHLSVNKDSGKEKFHDHDIAIPANYTEAENIVPTLGRDYKEYNKMKLRAQEKNVPKKSSEEKEQKAIPYKKFKGKRWPKFDTIFSEEFKEVMISRNFESAVVLYAKMKGSKFLPGDSALTALLTTCQKKNHLKKALEMFGDFSVIGSHPNESAYMSLIRCYSDNGEINQALGLIEDMKDSSLELKLRTYHPILEAACRINDFISALSIIKQMQLGNVVPRSEQLALFLEVSALSGALKETESRKEVDFLLQSAKTDLLGMDTHEMRRVISAFSNISIGSVLKEGILIESKNDIPGEILDSEDSVKNGIHTVVTAINDTYANVPTVMNQTLCIPAINDSNVPLGFNEVTNTVTHEPDIYTLASESEALNGMKSDLRNRRARLVDIPGNTCLCPNCGGKLIPLLLDHDERKRVRLGLMMITSAASIVQLRNIQIFAEWLEKKPEFKYVIDGANVAYNHQNFNDGKFSFKQIKILVDKIVARGDGKVLVLLPTSYAQKVVPNTTSSRQKGKKQVSHVSASDQRIIQRFEEEGMLYLVPLGADDDWYWIYATVTEGRKSPAFVVTNDLMRDHRLAFLEPRPFIRWRTTQVMSFTFSGAVKDDSCDPDLTINEPGKYSREIQQSEVNRWHIPAADRRAWLCLTTTPSSP